jgi:pimeloyl-ACP methyl ester carboxylesterase
LLDGIELHALHWGEPSRPTVVLLHGGGANAHWWDHLAPDLAQHLHVVALDFRGHGDSTYPDEYTVGAFHIDLEGLLERLGSDSVFLVGASMGGHVALDHAALHPATRGVVALDVARGGTRRSRRRSRLALTLRRTYASRAEATSRYGFFPPAEHVDEALRAAIAGHSVMEEQDGRFGYKFDRRWFSVRDRPRTELGSVRCPVLLVRGFSSAGRKARCCRPKPPKSFATNSVVLRTRGSQ